MPTPHGSLLEPLDALPFRAILGKAAAFGGLNRLENAASNRANCGNEPNSPQQRPGSGYPLQRNGLEGKRPGGNWRLYPSSEPRAAQAGKQPRRGINLTIPPYTLQITMKHRFTLSLIPLCLSGSLLVGCASSGVKNPSGVPVTEMRADEKGFVRGTGIESQDIETVADKMARDLLNVPQIAKAQGVPRIVLMPVKNETRFPINKDLFLKEIRGALNAKAGGKVLFLARDRMPELAKEREMKQTGQVTSSTDPNVNQFKGADLMLTGEISGLTTRTSAGTSDFFLYSFQLVDPNTTDIIWEGQHKVKKQGLEDASYR